MPSVLLHHWRPTLVSILLGAITTIAIAWSVPFWATYDGQEPQEWTLDAHDAAFLVRTVSYPGVSWYEVERLNNGNTQLGFRTRKIDRATTPSCNDSAPGWLIRHVPVGSNNYMDAAAWGWPLPCAWRVTFARGYGCSLSEAPADWRTGLLLCNRSFDSAPRWDGRVPIQPIPSALLINTTLYAIAWWPVCTLPFITRRRLRLRRNHCPTCNYDLRGNPSAPCPECGREARA